MTSDEREERPQEAAGPRELPEHLFRRGDDWKFLKAARRERRRREWKARLEVLARRDNRLLVLAVAAPVLVLSLAWLMGAVRW